MIEQTFSIIKPDAIERDLENKIKILYASRDPAAPQRWIEGESGLCFGGPISVGFAQDSLKKENM